MGPGWSIGSGFNFQIHKTLDSITTQAASMPPQWRFLSACSIFSSLTRIIKSATGTQLECSIKGVQNRLVHISAQQSLNAKDLHGFGVAVVHSMYMDEPKRTSWSKSQNAGQTFISHQRNGSWFFQKMHFCHLPVDGQILSVALVIGEAGSFIFNKIFSVWGQNCPSFGPQWPSLLSYALRKRYCDIVVVIMWYCCGGNLWISLIRQGWSAVTHNSCS